jgi:hypothetical protein
MQTLVRTTVAWTLVSIVAGSAFGATPIVYQTSISTSEGLKSKAAFSGSLDQGKITGALSLYGTTMLITAAVPSAGVVTGSVSLEDGTPFGTFSGKVDNASQALSIDYSVNGNSGTTSVPIPDALAPVLKASPSPR